MKISDSSRYALSVCAVGIGVAIFGGCSESPQSSQGLAIAPPSERSPSTRAELGSEVSLWSSLPSTNQLLGLSKDGMKEIAAINTVANGCYAPTGIKVGHKQMLWVACNYNNYEPTCLVCSGVIQVYAPGSNSPLKTYSDYMHIKCSEICYDAALPNDVAFDDKGHVFAANLVTTNCIQGHTHVCSTGRGGWTWWRASSPKSVHIEIGKVDTHFYYLDVDATGNLYITGAGTNGNGSQVFEITNPTGTSPGVTSILGPTKDHLGGLYVSNRGKVLNIVDETARTISQYALPWVTSELPINVLGPTLQESGKGVPISGGFDLSETRLALGDGMGWLDLGDVAENKWTVAAKNNLGSSAFGAAYVPSDK